MFSDENPKIVCFPNKILKEETREFLDTKSKTAKEEIKNIADDLSLALNTNMLEGLGIAAPQIGISKRIFIAKLKLEDMSADFFNENGIKKELDEEGRKEFVFVNPIMAHGSTIPRKKIKSREGCLSIPGITANLNCRSQKIIISALDEDCKPFSLVLQNEDAVVIQHEIDHLNGITMFERMGQVQRMMKKKKYKTFPKRAIKRANQKGKYDKRRRVTI